MSSKLKVISIDYYYDIVSISAWVLLEKLSLLQNNDTSISLNYHPIHAATLLTSIGNSVPYATPTLRKNYFEEQRAISGIHGITIKTTQGVIDNLLDGMSNSIIPQLALNMVHTEYGQSKLIELSRILWRRLWIENKSTHNEDDLTEALRESNISLTSDISREKWCTLLNIWQDKAVHSKCFGIPWTVLHFEDGSAKNFFGSDKWPLISSNLNLPYRSFDNISLPFR